jgi:hypothetical protein
VVLTPLAVALPLAAGAARRERSEVPFFFRTDDFFGFIDIVPHELLRRYRRTEETTAATAGVQRKIGAEEWANEQ